MARRILKYALDLAARGTQEVKMPKGTALSVGLQVGEGKAPGFVLWADVDSAAPEGYLFVRACETGDLAPERPRWRHVNTLQVMSMAEGERRMLVWHFYVDSESEG